jgi:hypothetical protein
MSRAPSRAQGRRSVSFALVALMALLLVLGAAPKPAAAAGDHHAAVIVDTGGAAAPIPVVVTFSGDSISGLEALQLAGADPAVIGFSGLGGAVCALDGVGHPATNATCLGEPSDPRFWAYWHVPAGQSGFNESTYSRAGAGSVRVHDGDVEGWRYGTGEPPRSVPIDLPAPETPAVTAPASAPPANPGAATAPAAAGVPAGAGTGAAAGATTGTTIAPGAPAGSAVAPVAGSSTTSTTRKGDKTEVAAERASASRDAGGGGGSPMLSIVGFVAVLAVLGAGIFFARRARVGRSTGDS